MNRLQGRLARLEGHSTVGGHGPTIIFGGDYDREAALADYDSRFGTIEDPETILWVELVGPDDQETTQ